MSGKDKLRRRGRIAGQAAFGAIVAGLTLMWTIQIVQQVFAAPPSSTEVQCRPGLRDLIGAVRQARRAAKAENGGERAALERFRTTLRPAWQARSHLDEACRDDPEAMRALREIDLLRYAEEHAVRYEVQELARRRQRVRAIEPELSHPPDEPNPAGPTASAVPETRSPD